MKSGRLAFILEPSGLKYSGTLLFSGLDDEDLGFQLLTPALVHVEGFGMADG